MSNFSTLANLGWQPFFQQQLSLEQWQDAVPARIIEQQRSQLTLATERGDISLVLNHQMPDMVVGDWLLLDQQLKFECLLERKSVFLRRASGSQIKQQLISANVDVAFIVCSLNKDFNLNRIERFLALAKDADAEPVVLLSKADLFSLADKADRSEELQDKIEQVQKLNVEMPVFAVNCLQLESLEPLLDWLKPGVTISLLGSSGVGKSSLLNSLLQQELQVTSKIRAGDDKGCHTTTSRSLRALPCGAMVLDTPGMREIQLAHCQEGIAATFSDIEDLARSCRFQDCRHTSEPGCAVQRAIVEEQITVRRFKNYQKLLGEESFNSASLAERRGHDKALSKYYKSTQKQAKKIKGY